MRAGRDRAKVLPRCRAPGDYEFCVRPKYDDSPALDITSRLWARGADVRVMDPAAGPELRRRQPEMRVCDTVEEALTGVDAVLLLTPWKEFLCLDPVELRGIVAFNCSRCA